MCVRMDVRHGVQWLKIEIPAYFTENVYFYAKLNRF